MRLTLNHRLALSGAVILMASIGGAPALAQNAFISNNHDNTVSIIDVPSGTVIGAVPVGQAPEGITVAPNGTTVYVANTFGPSVSVIDAAQFPQVVTATIPIPGPTPTSVAISPNGTTGYVPNGLAAAPELTIFLTADNTIVTNVPLPAVPAGVAVNPISGDIYVASGILTGQISVISEAGALLGNIAVTPNPFGLAVAPDGNKLYVTQAIAGINPGKVTVIDKSEGMVAGTISVGSNPHGIAISPDGTKVLVANTDSNSATLIDTATNAVITTIAVGHSPFGASFAPDGTKAFVTNQADGTVSEIDLATNAVTATITVGQNPLAFGSNFVGAAQPTSALLSSVLPGGRSVQVGTTATVFATMINTGATALNNCKITLPSSAPTGMDMIFRTTDANNNVVGAVNAPATIAPNDGLQSFLLANDMTQPLLFSCDDTTYAPIFVALNTIDLGFTAGTTPDIIALSATASGDGILNVPFKANQVGAFAVASDNNGAAATITASVDTGAASLPLSATICQTNPANSQCLAAPGASVDVNFAAGATPTFSVFVTASESVPLLPAANRIFVRFKDTNGVQHGSTSVAVVTDRPVS
jgi:YVTN family beta-propeller protein